MRDVDTLEGFAALLGVSAGYLRRTLYGIPDARKYSRFDIPKKTGGLRRIHAPIQEISFLQRRVKDLLQDCVDEIRAADPRYLKFAFGNGAGRSIVENAALHRNRKFVLNVDLESFYDHTHLGRVRGVLIADRRWSLNPNVATLIAQVGCSSGVLPQGGRCSSLLSDLVGNVLDARLSRLAKAKRCRYSRYVDDLTFSTNLAEFPGGLSEVGVDGRIAVGQELLREITRAGFKINSAKTRLQGNSSRQSVTGLVVNRKVNVDRRYYRQLRAMCHSLFKQGSYSLPGSSEQTEKLAPLEGMLAHAWNVQRRDDVVPVESIYRRFLIFKHFVASESPIVVPEGFTDSVYVKCALRSLATAGATYGNLARVVPGHEAEMTVRFLRSTDTTKKILNLTSGTAGQASLIGNYRALIAEFDHRPPAHPVIVLCDNDQGSKRVFSSAFNAAKRIAEINNGTSSISKIDVDTADPFYYVGDNLYVVKVPELAGSESAIESLFPAEQRRKEVSGRAFELLDGSAGPLGKKDFANQVVRTMNEHRHFEGFRGLLERLDACVAHFSSQQVVR